MPQTSLLSFLTSPLDGNLKLQPKQYAKVGRKSIHRPAQKSSKDVDKPRSAAKCMKTPILTRIEEHTGKKSTALTTSASKVEDKASNVLQTAQTNKLATTPTNSPLTSFALSHCPSIAISSAEASHLPALQRLTSSLLPIKYSDTFYTDVLSDPTVATFSRVALYTSPSSAGGSDSAPIPIGWIQCSLDPFPSPTSPPSTTNPIYNQVYIKALCLLAPFRGLGVATALLDTVMKQKELLKHHNVQFVSAHVWESNEEALEWYEKRGFSREMLVDGYYRKLQPDGAWMVRKEVGQEMDGRRWLSP